MTVESMMKSFSKGVIRYRWFLAVGIVLATGALVHATRQLTVNNAYDTWLPANDKVSKLYQLVDREFASNILVFAILDFTEKGVFHPESLALVERMTEELEGIEKVFNVTSLTNIVDIRKTETGIEVSDLITDIPRTATALSELREYVLSKEMYVNSLVSSDAAYTALVANIEGSSDEVVVAKEVLDRIKNVAGAQPYYFGGGPSLTLYLNRYMAKDMVLLIPVAFLAMIVILALSFRRFPAVVIPLTFVVLCLLWTFGLQAIFGMYVSILTPAVAVLVISMGADYVVHAYNHYLRRGDIVTSTSEITLPIIMSAATTIAVLLTFATTRIDGLRFFGLELAFGLGSACLLSIVLFPSCIYLFKVKSVSTERGGEQEEDAISKVLVQVGDWVQRHAKLTMFAFSLGLLIMALGISRITTNVDQLDLLPSDSPPRKGHDIIREHFGGIYPLSIYTRGDIEDPAVMQMENYMENFLRSEGMLSGFTSVNGLIAEENWVMNGIYAIPESRQGIANLWLLLEGEELLRTFVSDDRRQSLVTARVKEADTGVMQATANSVTEFLNQRGGDLVVVIDPERLPPNGQLVLVSVKLSEAAFQLAWLAQGYDKRHRYDPDAFFGRLKEEFAVVEKKIELEAAWEAARAYLEEETVEVLPSGLIHHVLTHIRVKWHGEEKLNLKDEIADMITAEKIMAPEDARMTADGLFRRVESVLRLARTEALRESLWDLMSPGLRQNNDFRKRADGVLWKLWSQHPVFFVSTVQSIPGLDQAVIRTKSVQINQTGLPDLFRRMQELLYVSQVQSLCLASLIVFVLVSITQRSLRRGVISLLSVLVPLAIVLGFMGWTGIPLDFGTALFAALIIGLGVDGSIHFLHYYQRLQAAGIKGESALRKTMGHVGKAIATANATTCCGFLILILSKTSALRNFALVTCMAIFLVTLSILTLLPALVTLFRLDDIAEEPSGDSRRP